MTVLAPFAVLLLATAPPLQKEDGTVAAGKVGRRLVEWAESAESVGFSGAVLAALDGKVIAAVGVGSADLKGKEPNTPATLFEIASATKQFTAAAVMRLVQEERLALDDSISEHLPDVPEDCRGITVRHLLQHTSGIPGTNSQGGGDKVERVMEPFLKGGPQHEPGTYWEYWNQGYALLSEIVARAADEDYVTYCKEALFEPAGMKMTCFTGDDAPRRASVAVGRSAKGAPRSAVDHPYGSYGFQYRGMGGAVTNVWDLWRWDRALHGDEVLGEVARAELFTPGLSDYALGWYARTDERGRLVQSHGGSVRGFVCEVRRYPEEDACLFVLINRDDLPAWRMAGGLEEVLFGDAPTYEPPPRPLDEKLLKAVAGSYEDSNENVVEIAGDGVVTRVTIRWAMGRVTNATLGLDEDGDLVLYEWTSATRVKLDRKGKKPARGLSIHGRNYERTR